MKPAQRDQLLHELADAISRRRLTTPARILLDVIEPFSFFAGQAALFALPLLPYSRWRSYVAALDSEAGWRLLQDVVHRQDS